MHNLIAHSLRKEANHHIFSTEKTSVVTVIIVRNHREIHGEEKQELVILNRLRKNEITNLP